MGITAVRSLLACSDKRHKLVWHEDVLSAHDRESINAAFPDNSRIIQRTVADELMNEILRDFPLCREFRRRHSMGLKLIDTLNHEHPVFLIYDSDILTMCPVSGLCDFPDTATDLLFMQDRQYSYRFGLGHAVQLPNGSLVRRLNAGFMLVRRESITYDDIERILYEHPHFRAINSDQTVWALLAARRSVRMWAPAQVALAYGESSVLEKCAVLHFTQPVRSRFNDFAGLAATRMNRSKPVKIETVEAERFARLELLGEIAHRKFINWAHRARYSWR